MGLQKWYPLLSAAGFITLTDVKMERIVRKSRSFADADAWDIQQQVSMTPQERMRAARALKDRLFPGKTPEVPATHARSHDKLGRKLTSHGYSVFVRRSTHTSLSGLRAKNSPSARAGCARTCVGRIWLC